MSLSPIETRHCGECTMCCVVPAIDDAFVQKRANVRCRHLAAGCTIYSQRPQVCRKFNCAWRYLDDLPDLSRPDRSGVLTLYESAARPGQPVVWDITLIIVERPFQAIAAGWFLEFIQRQALRGVPIFLGLAGPAGCRSTRVGFNPETLEAAAMSGLDRIQALAQDALDYMAALPPTAHTLVNRGYNMGIV